MRVAVVKEFGFAGYTLPKASFLVAAPQLAGETEGLIGNNLLSYADLEFDLPNGMIRMFKPRETAEGRVRFRPDGTSYRFVRQIPKSHNAAALVSA